MAKVPVRKPKKKVCVFCKEKISYVDYKDTNLLRKFISDRARFARVGSPATARSTSATSRPR